MSRISPVIARIKWDLATIILCVKSPRFKGRRFPSPRRCVATRGPRPTNFPPLPAAARICRFKSPDGELFSRDQEVANYPDKSAAPPSFGSQAGTGIRPIDCAAVGNRIESGPANRGYYVSRGWPIDDRPLPKGTQRGFNYSAEGDGVGDGGASEPPTRHASAISGCLFAASVKSMSAVQDANKADCRGSSAGRACRIS
jgi:hypothetical protein